MIRSAGLLRLYKKLVIYRLRTRVVPLMESPRQP